MKCCGTWNDVPVLGDMLRYPIITLIMERDVVTQGDIDKLMEALPNRPENREGQAVCACRSSGHTTLDSAVGLGLLNRWG